MAGEGAGVEKEGNGRKDHKGGDQLAPRGDKPLGENDRECEKQGQREIDINRLSHEREILAPQ